MRDVASLSVWRPQDLRAVYAYYTVPGKYTLTQLMGDALILAKNVRVAARDCRIGGCGCVAVGTALYLSLSRI